MKTHALDLTTYRAAVSDVISHPDVLDPVKAEPILAERLTYPEFTQVLDSTPGGSSLAIRTILAEVAEFEPGRINSAADLAEMVRICLLAHIDAAWWGTVPAFQRDRDVEQSTELVDLSRMAVGFRYRRQSESLLRRAVRTAERRLVAGRTPDPVGLRFERTRPEVVSLLNSLAADFARTAPPDTPPLWVTSLARSVHHQRRLRSLGYAAMFPSSHCTGYGMDIAMSWYRRHDADRVLGRLLAERCEAGQVNLISGDETWHVCLSPQGAGELQRTGG